VPESWSEADWIASVFNRVVMSATIDAAPSAIWSTAAAWLALIAAICIAPTSARSRVPTASDAASSDA